MTDQRDPLRRRPRDNDIRRDDGRWGMLPDPGRHRVRSPPRVSVLRRQLPGSQLDDGGSDRRADDGA